MERSLKILATLTLSLLFLGSISAQDRITIANSSGKTRTLEGTIIDFNPREGLVFRASSGSRQMFRYEQVLRVAPEMTPLSSEAEKKYDIREYAATSELFGKLREVEKRDWAKLYWTANRVRCLYAAGLEEDAYGEFNRMCGSEPFSPFFDSIPLEWHVRTGELTPERKRIELEALKWLDPNDNPSGKYNPVASLLAASILMGSSQNSMRAKATERLEALTFVNRGVNAGAADLLSADMRTISKYVAQLAVAQSWREKIPKLKNEQELILWDSLARMLPEKLRAGPMSLIGDGHAKLGNREMAVAYWMYAPLICPENRPLAGRSLFESGIALAKLGRKEQAEKLREELLKNYPGLLPYTESAKKGFPAK